MAQSEYLVSTERMSGPVTAHHLHTPSALTGSLKRGESQYIQNSTFPRFPWQETITFENNYG